MITRAAIWLTLLWGTTAPANNGNELSPNGSPFAQLVASRTDENGVQRRAICSGTFVGLRGRTALLTAAHCLTPASEVAKFRSEHAAELVPFRERVRAHGAYSTSALRALVKESHPLARALGDRLETLAAYTSYDVRWGGGESSAKRGRWIFHPLYLLGLLAEATSQNVLFDLALWIPNETPRGVTGLSVGDGTIPLTRLALFGFGEQWDRIQPADADYDGDGVPNGTDRCPVTPAGAAVDTVGCATEDLRLSHAFRGGRHDRGGLPVSLRGGYWFVSGDPSTPELIELAATPLEWQDARNTMPGRGDSGSGLVNVTKEGKPSTLLGVYHGPMGPRYETDRGALHAKARYENVGHPLVRDWLDQ